MKGETGAVQTYPAGAYLLTWNPSASDWATLKEDVDAVANGSGIAEGRWSCGNNTHIREGARLFLSKQGDPPRGLIGTAWATSGVHEDVHWDPQRAADGDTARFVNLRFDTLIDPSVAPPLDPQRLPPKAAERRILGYAKLGNCDFHGHCASARASLARVPRWSWQSFARFESRCRLLRRTSPLPG